MLLYNIYSVVYFIQNVYICPKQHQAKHKECEESLFHDLLYPRFLNKQLV